MSHQATESKASPLTDDGQAFENTSTNVAAAQMRNHLTNLAETVKDPKEKKASRPEPRVLMFSLTDLY